MNRILFILLIGIAWIAAPLCSMAESINSSSGTSEVQSQIRRMTAKEKERYLENLSESEKKQLLKMLQDEEEEKSSGRPKAVGTKGPLLKDTKPEPATESEKDEENAVDGKEEKEPGKEGENLEEKEETKELSGIEKIMSGEFPTDLSRELVQYGYDFFEKSGPEFTPMQDVPVGSDYIIGPGDEIKVDMWGRLDGTFYLDVDSEGTLNLPEIGAVNVAGLTFEELKDKIKRKVEAITGVNANVSMGRLRTIDVFIVGEAKYPATYSLSSLSTVITALYASGGPSKNGSLRNIKVRRNGHVTELDLYDFFTKGQKKDDMRLRSGDTIFIPVLGPVAGISGAVKRPAIYEMKGDETIAEIIELAGGILPTGELQNVVIERIEGQRRRVIKSFSLDPSHADTDKNLKMHLQDFDLIKIYPVYKGIEQVVYLEGHVKYPQEYELKPEMRLLDIIPSYNALLPEPYLPSAEIIRLMPPDYHPEIIQFKLGALLAGDRTQNLPLQDLDRIIIYDVRDKQDLAEVTIDGAVRDPGVYQLYQGMTVKDLIFQAGNLTVKAFMDKATLSRVVPGKTETELVEMTFSPKKAVAGMAPDDIPLKRNDTVRIREIPKYNQALEQVVVLEGEFVFPGEYAFSQGERLANIIEKAGGLTEYAYPFGAVFYRESVKEVQEARLRDYISRLEEDILVMSSQEAGKALDRDEAEILKQSLASRKSLVEKLKTVRPTGRMVIDLPELLIDSASDSNFELRPGDRLVVSKRPDSINIMGEVYNPTSLFAEKGKTVNYYLEGVGGITPNGDKDQIYVVKANGTVISKNQESLFGMAAWDSEKRRWVFRFGSMRLDPGDTVVVPKKVEVYPWMKTTKDFTQILYQVAVGAGVIIAAY